GNYGSALHRATMAARVYADTGSKPAAARIALVVADLALDMASTATSDCQSTIFQAWVGLAQPYLDRAIRLTAEDDDLAGAALARITQARYSRLRGLNEDRVGELEDLAAVARRRDDGLILVQSQTALGDELTYLG